MYYANNQIKRLKRDIRKTSTVLSLILTPGVTKMTARIKQHTDAAQRRASRCCAGRPCRGHAMQPRQLCRAHRDVPVWDMSAESPRDSSQAHS